MMSKMPVAGVVWQTIHYLVGFQRLGYDAYYVEAHARAPAMLMESDADDGSEHAARFIQRVMRRFDLSDRWAFQALHSDGRCYGMSESALMRLYASADLIINLHGGTLPRPEHSSGGLLVYVETDPVALQIELHDGLKETIDFLDPHDAFFTFAENYGKPECRLPVSDRFRFLPTRQPAVLDFWTQWASDDPAQPFTTIGNWQQQWREVRFAGETYYWSKHREFLKFLDLPRRITQPFELALNRLNRPADREMLEAKGWRIREALTFSRDEDAYRDYIRSSRGEFTVAKDQNIRLRTGWFSDRSATYLAAGRPVVTQDTAFGSVLPTGRGLFAFSTLDEIVDAIDRINADYHTHAEAAGAIARDFFDHDVVLGGLLAELGLPRSSARTRVPGDLVLAPVSRNPLRLDPSTIETISATPLPATSPRPRLATDAEGDRCPASIVVVTYNGLSCTRLCVETVLTATDYPDYELIVVDNASTDSTPDYLRELERRNAHVRMVLNDTNRGFAAACNQGLALADGDVLVVLNNDVMVAPGWLDRLVWHAEDQAVGAVGPVTNRIGNEAEVRADYRTYEEFARVADDRLRSEAGRTFEIPMLAMFCMAIRRDVFARVGPLDEGFEVGMFEDDDYARRLRLAGYVLRCAEDVFVHHFGHGSFGELVPGGTYARLFERNRRRFEEKWGVRWEPHRKRPDPEYDELVARVRDTVSSFVPAGATVAVVNRGDDKLLDLKGRQTWPVPRSSNGTYAGYYPNDSAAAIRHVEALRSHGADYLVFPRTSQWWLEHYGDLRHHLEEHYRLVVRDEVCTVFALAQEAMVEGE